MSKQKYWNKGLKFTCQQCGYCCSFPGGAVVGTETEFRQIANFLGIIFSDFIKDYTATINGYISIKSVENGPCIFYQNGCSIYPVRPTQCRTFPFWGNILKSAVRWEQTGETCRGIGKGKLWEQDSIKEQMRAGKQALFCISP